MLRRFLLVAAELTIVFAALLLAFHASPDGPRRPASHPTTTTTQVIVVITAHPHSPKED